MSFDSTNPGNLFGGTWERIMDRFLMCIGSTYSVNATGGSTTKTISADNMPSHAHSIPAHSHTLSSHTHTMQSHTHTLSNHTHTLSSHTHSLQSHTHTPTNSANYFTTCDGLNLGKNGTRRTWPASGGSVYYVHQVESGTIGERNATGGPTNNTSSAPSNNTTNGPSNNTSGGPSTANTSGPSVANTDNSTAYNTGSAGSGTAIDIMPPYIAVYMWKRIS